MEVNQIGGDLIIRFDNQQEAAALLSVLNGQSHTLDQRSADFGNWLYAWFYERVRRIGTQYAVENEGVHRRISPITYVPPKQGIARSI